MEKAKRKYASIFELDGIPQMSKALPLALQHVVAMIVGCVTPAIIVAGVAGLDNANRVMLIQSALIVSAISTFLQLFPIGKKGGFRLGSGLPVIMGVSFAYVPSMQAIAASHLTARDVVLVSQQYLVHRSSAVLSQSLSDSSSTRSVKYSRRW